MAAAANGANLVFPNREAIVSYLSVHPFLNIRSELYDLYQSKIQQVAQHFDGITTSESRIGFSVMLCLNPPAEMAWQIRDTMQVAFVVALIDCAHGKLFEDE